MLPSKPPATAAILPLELIEEILHRLPAKSLGLFRCVSKPLNALISSPQFINTRLARTNLPLEKLILICSDHPRPLHSVDFLSSAVLENDGVLSADAVELQLQPPPWSWDDVIYSVNGLVFLHSRPWMNPMTVDSLYLMNPMIGECVQLPSCPFTPPANLEYNNTTCGFGYESFNNDYKVVMLSFYMIHEVEDANGGPHLVMFVFVYSLWSNNWRRVNKSPIHLTISNFMPGVYLNGCLHWLRYGFRHRLLTTVGIACFNLESEEFEAVPLPGCVDDEKSRPINGKLGVINGCLCFVVCWRDSWTVDVWVMKQYGVRESWKKYSIYGLLSTERELCSIDMVSFLGDRDIVMKVGKRLVVYNVEGKLFTDLVICGFPTDFKIVGTYVESLISPKCSNGMEGGFERCVPIEDQLYLQLCLQQQRPQAHLQ